MTDPLDDRPDLVQTIDGCRLLTPKAIGLVFGISEAEVHQEYKRQTAGGGRFEIPKAWRLRGKEIQARYDTDDKLELLRRVLDEQERSSGRQ